ncbi:hypothetical protein HPB47_000389 [Ixodes persulcatus]|uniref:Uncharacterized protein n=1 Tax=Ixodes persulcatus TaxID=34615 RepID=A0AC60PTT1_IXOPE|nr:hypothetical protein HPB47_000389 [Ixodes persulcatus]
MRPEWVTLINRLYRGNTVKTMLAGLTYADDVALTAASVSDMQKLIDICTEVARGNGLKFNANTSAAVLFGGPQDPTFGSLRLGVDCQPSEEPKFSSDGISGVVIDSLKAVLVPGLTLANAGVCVPGDIRAHIERRQREVGRQALGCHGTVANEAVQGYLGWSSFEAHEATSKIAYDGRHRHMDSCRWAKRLFRYTHLTGLWIRWQKRLYQFESKYGFFADLFQASSATEWEREVCKKIRDQETQQWLKDVQSKTTLDVHVAHERTIDSEARLYDNSLGSRLLFEARAGALRTLSYRRHFNSTVTTNVCRVCGAHDKTVAHMVLECAGLRPTLSRDNDRDLQSPLELADMDTKPLRLGQPHQRTGLPRSRLRPPAARICLLSLDLRLFTVTEPVFMAQEGPQPVLAQPWKKNVIKQALLVILLLNGQSRAGRLNPFVRHYEPLSYPPQHSFASMRSHAKSKRSVPDTADANVRFSAYGRDRSVFADDFVMATSSRGVIDVNLDHIYSGELDGDPGSRVFGSLVNGVFEGHIATSEEDAFYVEPSWKYRDQLAAPAAHSVIYSARDVELPPDMESHGGCGLDRLQQQMARDGVSKETRTPESVPSHAKITLDQQYRVRRSLDHIKLPFVGVDPPRVNKLQASGAKLDHRRLCTLKVWSTQPEQQRYRENLYVDGVAFKDLNAVSEERWRSHAKSDKLLPPTSMAHVVVYLIFSPI